MVHGESAAAGGGAADWRVGRVGMLYRDLIADRCGGRLIASHIKIPGGGAVSDYVHFHRVFVQLIFCLRGWVRVVYEDQGPALVMQPGDCVLQPPEIRHRVLDCGEGTEVVEVSSPAEYETHADSELHLPSAAVRPERRFAGQRFVHHRAAGAAWRAWHGRGLAARDCGIGAAAGGAVHVEVVRGESSLARATLPASDDHRLFFGLAGSAALAVGGTDAGLDAGSARLVPPGQRLEVTANLGVELLHVAIAGGRHGLP